MTFKELLDSVTFDEVADNLIRNYHETEYSIGWFKIHFDMLRLMQPKHYDNMNSDVCHITMKDWEDGTGSHLHAFPIEGDYWEHSHQTQSVQKTPFVCMCPTSCDYPRAFSIQQNGYKDKKKISTGQTFLEEIWGNKVLQGLWSILSTLYNHLIK